MFKSPFLHGLARTQISTNTNCTVESPTFGEIAGVNPTRVQWKGLALLEEPHSLSRSTSQPLMSCNDLLTKPTYLDEIQCN